MVLYDVAAAFSARRAKEMFGTTIYSGSFYESIYSCEWLAFLVMADLARNWAIHRNVSLASATMALQIFEQEILVKDAFDYLAISQKFADAVCEFKHQSLVAGDYVSCCCGLPICRKDVIYQYGSNLDSYSLEPDWHC